MLGSIENELLIITKQTFEAFLKTDIPSDLIALYSFYYYTAKWQKTNQPKCTTKYTANALKWTEVRVRKAKKELTSLGFIEDVQQKNSSTGKVVGCYVKLNYIMKESNIHPHDFPQCGTIHSVEQSTVWNNPQCGEARDKCLKSNSLNALRDSSLNALRDSSLNALSDTADETPYAEIVNLFNTICVSFPRVTRLSAKRKETLNKRFKELGIDEIKTAFEKAESSNFLTGKVNPKWKATFDWIISSNNIVKILDGNYDDWQKETNEYNAEIYGEII